MKHYHRHDKEMKNIGNHGQHSKDQDKIISDSTNKSNINRERFGIKKRDYSRCEEVYVVKRSYCTLRQTKRF